jgi:Zn-dependent protease
VPPELANMVVWYVALLFSLCVHEAAHGAMADYCGDPSARLLGRVTLNPLAHIDPFGTVVLPLLMIVTGSPFLFGWAKPVPFNPLHLKDIRRDPVLIALAGPLSNLAMAIVFTVVLFGLRLVTPSLGPSLVVPLFTIGFALVAVNLVLMMFNLIPVPPLDGHHVLYYFLPDSGKRLLETIGPFGIIIAILLARHVLAPVGVFLNFLERALLGY